MMRKWCLVVVICTLLASQIWAQQKDDTNNGAKPATDEAAKNAPVTDTTSGAPASHSSLAAPDAPRAVPSPAPAAGSTEEQAPGRLWNKYEFALTYDYVNFHPNTPFDAFNSHGGAGEFAYNVSPWLGLVAEGGSYRFKRTDLIVPAQTRAEFYSFLFGPRLNLRRDRFIP